MRVHIEGIDGGRMGYLIYCECGWRLITVATRGEAWRTAADHASAWHGAATVPLRNARRADARAHESQDGEQGGQRAETPRTDPVRRRNRRRRSAG